jgi:hypothetical protein
MTTSSARDGDEHSTAAIVLAQRPPPMIDTCIDVA